MLDKTTSALEAIQSENVQLKKEIAELRLKRQELKQQAKRALLKRKKLNKIIDTLETAIDHAIKSLEDIINTDNTDELLDLAEPLTSKKKKKTSCAEKQ